MLDQLKAGIRYFDMRIKYNSSGELIIFHGPVDMKITFAEVVEEVK